jgi:tripartite-type tricarboxylate transporter receptor subunit TctC
MNTAEARETLSALGGDLLATTPEAFARHIAEETRRWRELIATAKIDVSQ